ncbi:MAG: IPTL-CTERM sorting domain-containing protein, partial [Thermodesulfobacteriota bacterium]
GDFEANALCSQGGCPPPVTGCCRTAPDMCSDNIIQSDCAGDFEANALCSQGGCPPPITGCCRTAPDMCSDNVEQGQCQGQFEANADCVNGCLPPVTGCCRTSPTMCQENIDQGQCQGDFEANANCSTGCLTEPVGCCRESANMCENGVLQSDCPDGEFEANATCENEGCDNTPTGCCRTSIDMCQDGVLETNCENGEFEANAGCDTGGCVVEPIGCCRTSADMCQDGVMESNCTNGEFEANSTCSEGCNTVPTGCCRTGQGSDMCEDGVLESNCANGEFEANAGCDTGGCESEPVGCCRTLDMCQEGVLESNCEDGDFEANATCAEGCNADPIGCCVDSENDTCESPVFDSDCDGTFSAALSCNIFGGCGDPLVVNGCCEIGDTCEDVTNVVCAGRNGDFTPNEMCNIENTCGPLPTGCCLEDDICRDNVLESNCDGLYNENTSCGSGDCIVPDGGCCFLNGAEESAFIASRQVDPEKCVETTMVMCENLGGSFQGEGTMCTEFPDECGETPPATRNVPTISQWGLIVMAGLLGIFSLYVIARRQKYNVV